MDRGATRIQWILIVILIIAAIVVSIILLGPQIQFAHTNVRSSFPGHLMPLL